MRFELEAGDSLIERWSIVETEGAYIDLCFDAKLQMVPEPDGKFRRNKLLGWNETESFPEFR